MEKDSLPKVSIIIPCFNAEKTIKSCLDSVMEQSYPNLEVIVIDDGSKDKTVEIVSKYPVRLIPLRINFGAPHAMNVAAEVTNGKYIAFLDSDASAPKCLISKTVDIFEKNADCEAGGGWYKPVEGNKLYSSLIDIGMHSRKTGANPIQVYEGKADPVVYGCFMVFKKDILSKEKFMEQYKAIYDREFMARLCSKGSKVFFSSDLFVFHPVPATLRKVIKTSWVQSMWLGFVGKKRPIIIKQNIVLLLATVFAILLSIFVWPIIFPLFLFFYAGIQFRHFFLVRKKFSLSLKQVLSLVGLNYLIVIISLVGCTIGLLVKPRIHWK
jgi:glycosyltransferase involved in cell wall biosynthesis